MAGLYRCGLSGGTSDLLPIKIPHDHYATNIYQPVSVFAFPVSYTGGASTAFINCDTYSSITINTPNAGVWVSVYGLDSDGNFTTLFSPTAYGTTSRTFDVTNYAFVQINTHIGGNSTTITASLL